MKKTFRSTLAALVCGAVALVGCSTGSVSTNTTDQELREKISNSGELPNPRDLEGVDEVKDFGEPVPVAGNPSPTLPVELTDADGYEVTVTDISRILALDLYGSYTKTLIGLGLGDNIVGRTVSSTEESLKDRPLVTQGGHNLNVEAVLSLEPSLVIVDHSVGPRDAIDQIRDAGVTVVVMEPERTIDSVGRDIENVAGVVGVPEVGEKLAKRSMDDIVKDREAIADLIPEEPMRMAFLYARGNGGVFFILGEGTGAQDLIEGIGGIDVAAENGLKDAAPANAEALAKINPDMFIMMTDGLKSTGGVEGLLQRPGILQTTAGQKQRIVTLPDGQSLAFGPNTGEVLLRAALAAYNPDVTK